MKDVFEFIKQAAECEKCKECDKCKDECTCKEKPKKEVKNWHKKLAPHVRKAAKGLPNEGLLKHVAKRVIRKKLKLEKKDDNA
jgi:hypothetical protein